MNNLLQIFKAPHPKLKQKAQTLKVFDHRIEKFAADMIYTMYKNNGCGLASIQVEDNPSFHELQPLEEYRAQPNIFIISSKNLPATAIINPIILDYSKETQSKFEGCLSVPFTEAEIRRPTKIKVQYQNIKGETIITTFSNIEARVFQHEFDHNQGILYPNRLKNKLEEILFWKNYNQS